MSTKLTPEALAILKTINPKGNNAIVRLIKKKENKEGMIVIPDQHVAESTQAEILIPPKYSYHPNGDLKDCEYVFGEKVRLPVGKIGTEMPEAPEGETWLAIPEDCFYYSVK